MSMIINHNLPALGAYSFVGQTSGALKKSIERLSTGLRINRAADDAAGLAISERRRAQISGADRAVANIQDGISMMQTAEGALNETHGVLQRMRELSVQAANDTLTQSDRASIQSEIAQLRDEVTRIGNTTQFNRKKLLNGDAAVISSSSDAKTRAIITGGLRARDGFAQVTLGEGNYNISVESTAGRAEVRKSNVFKIKHEDVVIDVDLNEDAGIKDLSVKGLPVAEYDVELGNAGLPGVAVTGSYGVPSAQLSKVLKGGATGNLKVNASILFEVTDVNGTDVTLKATANTLTTDGIEGRTSATVTLTEGQWTDLSTALGLGTAGTDDSAVDGAFELQLQSGGAAKFAVGNKFVYNATVGKDVQGADRTVSVTGIQEEEWPKSWTQQYDIQASKVLGFPPGFKWGGTANVLFLIDDSGSMRSGFTTVKDNVEAFVETITGQGVDDVQIGIATYCSNTNFRARTYPDGSLWSSDLDEIKTLVDINPSGGWVDHYYAIKKAVETYGDSFGKHPYIVLVTDTSAEGNGEDGVDEAAALAALQRGTEDTADDICLSVIRPSSATGVDDLANATGGKIFTYSTASTATWGSQLSVELGQKIGQESVEGTPPPETPLNVLEGINSVLESGGDRTITIHQGENSVDVTVGADDKIEDLVTKLNDAATALGMASDGDPFVTYAETVNEGRPGTVTIRSTTPGKEGKITFSGDAELLNALGFHTEKMKSRTPVSDVDIRFSLDASEVTDKTIHFRNFYLNSESGAVHEGDIILTTNSTELGVDTAAATFETTFLGEIAKGGTRLRDLDQFWDASGNFLLDDPQTLTITQGDGQQTSITLYAGDTLNTVAEKLNAVIGDTFGQAEYVDKNGRDKFVTFVDDEDEEPDSETVRGTLLIRSAVPGAAGKLNFSGSEELLNALGLNTIQEATESRYTVNVTDAHTGAEIVKDAKVTGNRLVGVLHPNIDVEFDAMSGITATWDEDTKSFIQTGGSRTTTLHLADNTTTFQAGVNQGEDMSIHIGDMRAHALGLDGVLVTDRESAARSVTLIDNAIDTVSMQRARLGAYQRRLEHAAANMTTTGENLTAAEGRVRDADMAKEMMEFTKLQILLQSGNSMLAQANQHPQAVLNLIR